MFGIVIKCCAIIRALINMIAPFWVIRLWMASLQTVPAWIIPLCLKPRCLIDTLPLELLLEVTRYLETKDIHAFQDTCQSWKYLITDNPKIWSNNVVLHGSDQAIDRQWMEVNTMRRGHNITSLTVYRMEDMVKPRPTLRFETDLPTGLIEFDYRGHGIVGPVLWDRLTKSTKLKVLRVEFGMLQSSLQVDNLPIEQCRLDELELFNRRKNTLYIETGIYNMVSTLKRLRIDCRLNPDLLYGILQASKDTLVDLHLLETSDYHIHVPITNKQAPIVMAKLETFCGNFPATHFSLIAPRMQTLNIVAEQIEHLDLLLQCCKTIQTLRIGIGHHNSCSDNWDIIQQVQIIMTQMPQCHSLTIDSLYASKGLDVIHLLLPFREPKVEDILPNLDHLTIKLCHVYQDQIGERLLYLLQHRGLFIPNSMTLINCAFTKRTMVKLEDMIPNVKNIYMEVENQRCNESSQYDTHPWPCRRPLSEARWPLDY